jgi:hypothetical protein
MPYILLADRPMFDTMIDGLVPKIRGFGRDDFRKLAANFVTYALTSEMQPYRLSDEVTGIISSLGVRVRVRGDANYCLCRIMLEGMKPEAGWSYHSLSDVVAVIRSAIGLVLTADIEGYDDYIKVLRDVEIPEDFQDAVSVLNDSADEIVRRLLGPYEDKAIRKNGDMACFANEDFAYLPPLELEFDEGWRQRERDDAFFVDLSFPLPVADLDMSDLASEPQVRPLPDIREALTQQQLDIINEERRADEG